MDKITFREFPRRIEIFFILLVSLLLLSTLAFKFINNITFHDAFVMTAETLAFIYHSHSGLGKALEIFLSIFGVFLLWWILWGIFDLLLEGNFTKYLKIRRTMYKLEKMRNHYIIAGGGRVGEEIVKYLLKEKKDYVIIERDVSTVNKLKKEGLFVIYGDVTNEDVLKQAGIKDAKVIILAMPETEKNLLVTMIAKEINPKLEIHARADKPAFVSKLKKAGAKIVVVPEVVAAEKFIEAIK
jgi:voltage-gated potassium channel